MTVEYKDSKRISALSSDFPITTTTYDHIGDTNNAGLHAINTAGGHDGLKVGIKIIAGSPAIGTKIEYVSMSIRKWGSSTGNYQFQVIDGTDGTTVLASATSSASALTETPATVELQLDSVVTLSVNDRIVLAYPDGSGSNIIGLARNSATTESGYNRTILGYSPATWSDTTVNNMIMTFDSSPATVSKPTNVQDNSILVEKDTGKRYWFSEATAVTEETLDSTNGTTDWNVDNGGSDITIDTGNNEIDITGTGQKSGYYDLGASVSASAWVLRFKIASSGSPSGNPLFWVGMFDVNTIDSRNTNVDGISLMIYTGSTYKLSMKNGSHMDSGGSQTNTSPTVSADTTTRYVEIVRNGSNAILTFYDSDTYTTSIGTCTVAITGTSFRYLCAISYFEGSGRTYSLSNVKLYNGVTSATPATWTINPTFEDDFSSDSWTSVGSTVSISGGNLSASSVNTASDDRLHKGLGFTLSNSVWVCQFEVNLSTSNYTNLIALTDRVSNMNAYDTILCDYNGSNIKMREYNGSTLGLDSTGIAVSTGTQYYITLTRTGETGLKLEVRTDSHTGALVGGSAETGTISSGTVDLNTIQSGAYGRASGTATYNIDNVKIYNGVSSL